MDAFSQLLNGFAVALTPMNLLWCLVGTTLGTAIGVLPGLGPALTIALLLPITFKVEPTAAFILFAGIYYGAMYGGSTTSILLNTPGESGTIVTALEGNKIASKGRAGRGPGTAATGALAGRTHRRLRGGGSFGGRGVALPRLALPLRQGRDHSAVGLDLADGGRMEALMETVAARRRHRLSDRRHAGRRRRDPDLSELLHREEALLEAAGVGKGAIE